MTMSRQISRNLRLLGLLLLATFLSESPRVHVEGRTLTKREVETTTINNAAELTTANNNHAPSTTEASITEATTSPSTSSTEFLSFTSSFNTNRLYDELKSTQPSSTLQMINSTSPLLPTTFSSFETSSENMKFERLTAKDEESKWDESSMEKKFNDDEMGFRNNATKEERHQLNEAVFDEETVKYSSKMQNHTDVASKEVEEVKTTVLPLTTAKKGKYLDLMPAGDDNMNASLPNTAEVWALAGMKGIEARKPVASEESSGDVEMSASSLNNTSLKNLLDWTEIAKMSNETEDLKPTTVFADISDDPATSENKDVKVFASQSPSTLKPIEDNRLEIETSNGDFGGNNNKSHTTVASRFDFEVFGKNQDEGSVELIDPFKKLEELKTKENLNAATTESSEGFTTETVETTTMENLDTTTSIVDTFTVIGEDEDADDIFKRTITEYPSSEAPSTTTSMPVTTTEKIFESTTEIPLPTFYETPESTVKTTALPTKSISTRVVTTSQPEDKQLDTTSTDNDAFSSTLVPKFSKSTSRKLITTTPRYEDITETSSISTIEIGDDEKFKYSTLLPELTTVVQPSGKNGELEESTTRGNDSLSKESLDGESGSGGSSLGVISAVISVLVVLVLAGVGYFVYKRRNKQNFSQRCRPVGLDAYSLDNVSVYNSVRRKANALRLSKRSYGNSAFEDPSLQSNVLDYQSLQDFAQNKKSIQDEFKDIPQISVRVDEVPDNCEDKNRYANVVPLPETRVHLQRLGDDEKTEYINANFVKGPKDNTNYYIATQAPLENTVGDFWRMVWEQNSKVIIMATDLTENGVERCAEYIPASVVLDNSLNYGDFQVTLKSRDVKGKYAVSQLHVKNLKTNIWREIMHLWYSWPENGCPTDEASIVSMLLEARGYLRTTLPEQLDENSNMESNDKEKLSTLDKTKSLQRVQGPLTVHCSPGTGRTGTLIACDIVMRYLEIPPRQIDIPQIVYAVRRGRASAVRTRDQYEFIYSIANAYAVKLNTAPTET